ncbi:hypothetical protein KDW55_16420 [Burkholderia sp. AU19243]|uniref:hypothetical protein n=1 Tax=Burkholderia sp. AU19243 TaxID=2824810 RepID=UPI001B923348|nr:hypothetical protein [Burkholderia sp. AU19243]MBR8142076.1 hypothetical protein [Burkholderia vietnamiensis]MBR8364903.1 hypothetical protein [Burkholderia sp. AU19243]
MSEWRVVQRHTVRVDRIADRGSGSGAGDVSPASAQVATSTPWPNGAANRNAMIMPVRPLANYREAMIRMLLKIK